MATVEERFRKLVDDNLEIDGRPLGRRLDLNSSLRDSGVSSVDFVAFAKLVAEEFNVTFSLEDCDKYNTVGEVIEFLGHPAWLGSQGSQNSRLTERLPGSTRIGGGCLRSRMGC